MVRLIQAESEAIALVEAPADKRPRTAALNPKEPPTPKAPPATPPVPAPSVAVVQQGSSEVKDKGKGKGKGEGSSQVCHKFADATGCKFGDACMFRHDRAKARRENRCLACGQQGHFRPDCTLVAPENRVVLTETSPEGSPKAGQPPKVPKSKAKAKSGAQAKGITEEGGPKAEPPSAGAASQAGVSAPLSQESLVAEAAKLLKGVSLKPVHISPEQVDSVDPSWLLSAVTSVSDCGYALVDSGATNALRPAESIELGVCRVIRVDWQVVPLSCV